MKYNCYFCKNTTSSMDEYYSISVECIKRPKKDIWNYFTRRPKCFELDQSKLDYCLKHGEDALVAEHYGWQ